MLHTNEERSPSQLDRARCGESRKNVHGGMQPEARFAVVAGEVGGGQRQRSPEHAAREQRAPRDDQQKRQRAEKNEVRRRREMAWDESKRNGVAGGAQNEQCQGQRKLE